MTLPDRTIPTSKTALTVCVRALDADAVLAGLRDSPQLLDYRDERGRTWLHLCASVDPTGKQGVSRKAAIPLATGLLQLGLDVNDAAFSEGTSSEGKWHATPLWYAVSRGKNPVLAKFLLEAGSTPEHCLWAASFLEDIDILKPVSYTHLTLPTSYSW